MRDKAGDGARDAERDWARDVARESWREVVASEEDNEPQREPEMLELVAPGGITWTLHRDSDAADNEPPRPGTGSSTWDTPLASYPCSIPHTE